MSDRPAQVETRQERYVRPLSAESSGAAPGRGRLKGRRILVVGGGQRTFDAATDPIGNGRAMSILFAREGAQVGVADVNRASAEDTVEEVQGFLFSPAIPYRDITRLLQTVPTKLEKVA